MHNSLWTNIHIRACGHLSVLTHTECIVSLPIVLLRVIGNHHTVRHHHPWCILMRREQTKRMTRVHHQCLLVCHLAEILHHKSILRPVLEHGTVASVGNQFVWMLRYCLIQVVLYHHHDSGSLLAFVWIFVNGTSVHIIRRTEAIHIDTSISLQLVQKLWCQGGMKLLWEVTQCVAQCQLLFFWCKNVFSLRCMVHRMVIRLWIG